MCVCVHACTHTHTHTHTHKVRHAHNNHSRGSVKTVILYFWAFWVESLYGILADLFLTTFQKKEETDWLSNKCIGLFVSIVGDSVGDEKLYCKFSFCDVFLNNKKLMLFSDLHHFLSKK